MSFKLKAVLAVNLFFMSTQILAASRCESLFKKNQTGNLAQVVSVEDYLQDKVRKDYSQVVEVIDARDYAKWVKIAESFDTNNEVRAKFASGLDFLLQITYPGNRTNFYNSSLSNLINGLKLVDNKVIVGQFVELYMNLRNVDQPEAYPGSNYSKSIQLLKAVLDFDYNYRDLRLKGNYVNSENNKPAETEYFLREAIAKFKQ